MTQLRWLLTAAIAAYACQLAVHHATPIDRALPFVALAVTLVAALSYPSLMLGVPLLILAEIAIPDEATRLLAFGAVVAVVWSAGVSPADPAASRRRPSWVAARDAGVPIALLAILLLRWIPFEDVRLGREIFLLVIAALIVLVLDRTPFAVAVAVIVALITPAIPLRTLLLPLAVLFAAVLAKVFGMRRVALTWPSTIAMAVVMLFFAWSGVMARAFPYFLQRARPEVPRHTVAQALQANVTGEEDGPQLDVRTTVRRAIPVIRSPPLIPSSRHAAGTSSRMRSPTSIAGPCAVPGRIRQNSSPP